MVLKYNANVDNEDIKKSLARITNLVFKILPQREEGGEWESTLRNLIVEVVGMNNLFNDQVNLFPVLCKMEGLLTLTKEEDFLLFRKGIFECLSLLNGISKCLD